MPKDFITPCLISGDLDLSIDLDFLVALNFASNCENPIDIDESLWQDNLSLVKLTHPIFTNPNSGELAVDAVWNLFLDFKVSRRTEFAHGWLAVFRTAFDTGVIDTIAYGAALRCLVCMAKGNVTPWHSISGVEAQREIIAEIRRAAPEGFTRPGELEELEQMPDQITVYRGGCSMLPTYEQAIEHGRQGMFWTAEYDIASYYLGRRTKARRKEGRAGWPFLIATEVDKSAVLGFGRFGDLAELFVDFDAIDPADVRCALPDAIRDIRNGRDGMGTPKSIAETTRGMLALSMGSMASANVARAYA